MKKPMKWHRDCVNNALDNLRQEEALLASHAARIAALRQRVAERATQYAEAAARGVKGYDAERFGKKRGGG